MSSDSDEKPPRKKIKVEDDSAKDLKVDKHLIIEDPSDSDSETNGIVAVKKRQPREYIHHYCYGSLSDIM